MKVYAVKCMGFLACIRAPNKPKALSIAKKLVEDGSYIQPTDLNITNVREADKEEIFMFRCLMNVYLKGDPNEKT